MEIEIEDFEAPFYHDQSDEHKVWHTRNVNPEDREFISWDGEGVREGKRQNYALFGSNVSEPLIAPKLHTDEMLQHIIDVGAKNPTAWHVAFAFEYDVNMILRDLTVAHFQRLRTNGYVKYKNYRIEHVPSKWLQITQYGETYPENKRDRITVKICDTFGFFQTSFVKALKAYLPDHPLMVQLDIIEKGKQERKHFTFAKIQMIETYWRVEIALMKALIEKLRELLYSVNLKIKNWHGPGALANYAYQREGVRKHKSQCSEAIYDAARFAYAGGRFERFYIGRFNGGWSYDLNSAYPWAISRLPSLTEGEWRWNPNPSRIVEFGVYNIRMRGNPLSQKPAPLFHRDSAGNMSYPWVTEGWYWSPEAQSVFYSKDVEILGGWEYVGWKTRPFRFVEEIYRERREMKIANIAAQMALKLLLNSLYGKQAQRVGWERTGGAPKWHQLEWAGYVTSATRARLYQLMSRIPRGEYLIAVETDGLYTTANPIQLGVSDSLDLGGWEIKKFQEILYVQSGMYAIQTVKDGWKTKYRGLDDGSITPDILKNHLQILQPNLDIWPKLIGPTTRFVGYRQALWRQDMNMGPMKVHHCQWESDDKDLDAGNTGKRVHQAKYCKACKEGMTAYEAPHSTTIRSAALLNPKSTRHDIPWIDANDIPYWRLREEGLVA